MYTFACNLLQSNPQHVSRAPRRRCLVFALLPRHQRGQPPRVQKPRLLQHMISKAHLATKNTMEALNARGSFFLRPMPGWKITAPFPIVLCMQGKSSKNAVLLLRCVWLLKVLETGGHVAAGIVWCLCSSDNLVVRVCKSMKSVMWQ